MDGKRVRKFGLTSYDGGGGLHDEDRDIKPCEVVMGLSTVGKHVREGMRKGERIKDAVCSGGGDGGGGGKDF